MSFRPKIMKRQMKWRLRYQTLSVLKIGDEAVKLNIMFLEKK